MNYGVATNNQHEREMLSKADAFIGYVHTTLCGKTHQRSLCHYSDRPLHFG
ncbi:MAG: hypothetical protein AAGA75_06360 [Cyanobacteria bacterium P01_E01_bin.6]